MECFPGTLGAGASRQCFLCGKLLLRDARRLHCSHRFHAACVDEWAEAGEEDGCPECAGARTTDVLAEIRGLFR